MIDPGPLAEAGGPPLVIPTGWGSDLTDGIPEEWCEAIEGWASQYPRIQQVYAFGSRAKGTFRDNSDIDLALFVIDAPGETALTYAVFHGHELEEDLATRLPVPVDIEFAYPQDDIVLPAVIEHGILLFNATSKPESDCGAQVGTELNDG